MRNARRWSLTFRSCCTGLHSMEQIETPPRLVYVDSGQDAGPARDRNGLALRCLAGFSGMASMRFAYGALSVAGTFVILLTAAGFSWRKPKLADLQPANYLSQRGPPGASRLCERHEVRERSARRFRNSVAPAAGQRSADEPGRAWHRASSREKAAGPDRWHRSPRTPRQQNRAE